MAACAPRAPSGKPARVQRSAAARPLPLNSVAAISSSSRMSANLCRPTRDAATLQRRLQPPMMRSGRRRVKSVAAAAGSGSNGSGGSPSDWPTICLTRTGSLYQGTQFAVDFIPPSGAAGYQGVVIFLHGFEQVPRDYATILERIAAAGMWVIAPVQPQFVPEDPVFSLPDMGLNTTTLQPIVHADANQVATLLFSPGPDGKPSLNREAASQGVDIDIGPIDGKQIGISGHSLGGGMTWSIVGDFPGKFVKSALMAPFPKMDIDALSPETVIQKPGFQPPGQSLIIEGGCDILAPAFLINKHIVGPLAGLKPPPAATRFEFPFGTHTGYQDETGIGYTPIQFPGGVLATLPQTDSAAKPKCPPGSLDPNAPRLKLIAGAFTKVKVFTLPKPVEDVILALADISPYFIYVILLGLLYGTSSVTGHWADGAGFLSPLWRILSVVMLLLIPFEIFEVLYYAPFVQRPDTTTIIGDFISTQPSNSPAPGPDAAA